jgi:NADPH-dependent stearoyl-CoA 9-desaturase
MCPTKAKTLHERVSKLVDTQADAFAKEITALRLRILADLGAKDAQYIKRVLWSVRSLELVGRIGLLAGAFLPSLWLVVAWIGGVVLLGLSKILNNMELGHNVMHGQFNWMNDPRFSGKHFEWDIVATGDNWRKTHNFKHHTYTNVRGMDDDLGGYGVLRLFPEQAWSPARLAQPLYALIFALLFQWGVAIQGLKLGRWFNKLTTTAKLKAAFRPVGKKMRHQMMKDYVWHPLLAGPGFLFVLSGNFAANIMRNIWTYVVIFCGHFTSDVATFAPSVLKDEREGHWYERQIRGSSNLSGSRFFHIMTGNLSHQIEHHLFPDVPANRYAELAPYVQRICQRYGIPYNTGSMGKQFSQVLWRIFRHSFPSQPSQA